MSTWFRRGIHGISLLLALTLALTPKHLLAMPNHNHVVQIRVELTDEGFNGKSGEFTVEVEQGHIVELTFVWAHKVHVRDEHIMVLDGYKLETDKLDANHKEATIKFPADKTGTFGFHCDIECEAHDHLQRGFLKVKPGSAGSSGGAPAATRTATQLTIAPSAKLLATGDTTTLMTTLKDKEGKPVPKAQIYYYLATEFGGVKDKMELGYAKTDANGVAFFEYRPTLSNEKHIITAYFEGMGLYDESQQVTELQLIGEPLPAYRMASIGLEPFREWAPVGLAAIVLAIWGVFGYVLFQAISVARHTGNSDRRR